MPSQQDSLDTILKRYQKQHGTFLRDTYVDYGTISSSSIVLDSLIGGGWPIGKITEIWGEESSGKSTLSLCAIGEFHEATKHLKDDDTAKNLAVYIDAEESYDDVYAKNLGVDLERLHVVSGFGSGEETFDFVKETLKTERYGIYILDSIAVLSPIEAQTESFQDSNAMGRHAAMTSNVLRTINPLIAKHQAAFLILNQVREKPTMYGDPRGRTGGRAMLHYPSLSVFTSKAKKPILVDKRIYGWDWTFKLTKTKIRGSQAQGAVMKSQLKFSEGPDRVFELKWAALELGIIQRVGNSYFFEEEKIASKKDELDEKIYGDMIFVDALGQKISEVMKKDPQALYNSKE